MLGHSSVEKNKANATLKCFLLHTVDPDVAAHFTNAVSHECARPMRACALFDAWSATCPHVAGLSICGNDSAAPQLRLASQLVSAFGQVVACQAVESWFVRAVAELSMLIDKRLAERNWETDCFKIRNLRLEC